MTEPFVLHGQLAQDSVEVCVLSLCQVRLSKDARFPWLILVPQRNNVAEIIDLSASDQALLLTEIKQVSVAIRELFRPDKLNTAALGNVVPQLHIHIIARFCNDAAWPNPVWGFGQFIEYSSEQRMERINQLAQVLS